MYYISSFLTWSFEIHWRNSKAIFGHIHLSSLDLKYNPVITWSEQSKNCWKRRKKDLFITEACVLATGRLPSWPVWFNDKLSFVIAISLFFLHWVIKFLICTLEKKKGNIYLNIVRFIFVKYFQTFRKGTVQNVNIY